MDDLQEENQEVVGKKRKANKDLWKRSKRKSTRLKGEQYVNQKGQLIPAKDIGSECR